MTLEDFRAAVKARWPGQAFCFGSSRLDYNDRRVVCYSAETDTDEHWWCVSQYDGHWAVQSQDLFYTPNPDSIEFIAAGGDTLDEALANLHEVMLYEYTEERE